MNIPAASLQIIRRLFAGERVAVPEGLRELWPIFLDLHQTRATGMGPSPISFTEIEAYARLMRWPLQPHHVETIRAMDRAWLDHISGEDAPRPARPAQPVNPAAFDAVFG
jgi:hypothetical protein